MADENPFTVSHGIGIVASSGDPYVYADLDNHVAKCEPDAFARDFMDQFDTYVELSPSGKGLRLIFEGSMPVSCARNSDLGLEIYQYGQYLTLTGAVLGQRRPIANCQSALTDLLEMHFADKVCVQGFLPCASGDHKPNPQRISERKETQAWEQPDRNQEEDRVRKALNKDALVVRLSGW